MANVFFKTSTNKTIDDLFIWTKSSGALEPNYDEHTGVPFSLGTVYFTSDGYIVFDTKDNLGNNKRIWMGKNAYSAIYAEDISETHTDIANTYLKRTGGLLEGSGTAATSASEQRSGDTSATTYYYPAVWRFNIAETPKNGDIIVIKAPVAGHDNGVFISIDYDSSHPEQAHYQPVLANGTSRLANQYGAGTSLILIYEANTAVSQVYNVKGSKARVNITGAWRVLNYYDSTNIYQLRTGCTRVLGPSTGDSTATKSLYKFEFLIEDKNGLLIPFGFQNDKATTYNKALTTASFNPFSPIFYYFSTTTVNVGSNIAAHSLYGQTIADCRYSFNINSNGTAGTTAFTANLPVYIKALYNYSTGTATFVQNISSSNYLERSSLTQNLPTTNPNINLSPGQEYIYIQLGNAYNKYQVDLNAFNKVVYHWDSINNTCKLFTPVAVTNNTINLTRNTETTIATINNTPIKIKLPVSDNTDYKVRQTSINSNDNNNYRILLSNSANDTSEDSVSKKNANLIYNPTENKLSTGNLDLTGNINVVGDATFNNTTTIDNAILNSLLVSGNSSFVNNVNFTQIPTAPTAAAGTNTTQIATTEFVTNAVAQGFVANDAMVFKGLIGSNQPITQLPTSGYNAGWTYRVANAGIFAGEYCEVGDLLIAIKDGPASGSSVINTDWGKVEHNIDGAVFRGSGASNSSVGSSTQPVYVNGSGIVTAITSLEVEAGGTGKDSRRKAGLFYDWTTSLKGQKWSRICYIPCTNNLLGSTMILNIRHTRSSVVYNETVIITVHHNSRGNITSLSSSNYNQNTSIQIRALANSSGHCYIELKDSNQRITEGTTISPVYCTLQIITLGDTEPTLKTSFEDGTTLPENYSVAAEVALGRNRIITSGIFSGNLEGNATTATTASKLSNTSKIGDTNKPVYFKADGTPAAINYTIATSVPSGAVFTDRYVNSAAFADDSTNTAASPVKMTLTRAGSDTATVTASIPKVSSSSAGVAPKGAAVSSQNQSTKFLREDGTWAAPSYTVNTNTDTLVKQTAKSDNKNYKILFTKSDSPTSGNASEAAYDTAITINPSTHTLTAVNLKGILSTQDLRRPTGLRGLNDVTLQPLVSTARANRLAFLPADQIIIEKTIDGGATWVDAGISDIDKLKLFSEQRSGGISLPMINGARNVLCGLRITFTAIRYNVPAGTPETEKYNYWNSTYFKSTERYCQLKELYFWLNSLSDSIGVTVQRATGKNPNNWSTIFDDSSFYMTGWSGCNYVNFSQHIFGGFDSQAGYPWNYRITFMTKGVDGTNTMATSSTTTPQTIEEIRGYGDSYWAVSNSYMARDHIYSFDENQNTTFPANVSATKFIGSLQGNATTATVASKLSNTSAIGSSTQPVYFNSSGQPVAVNKYDQQTGKTTDFVPCVKSDGVMEIGKYIDFHNTSEDTSNYIVRIKARDSSETDGAGLTLTGTTVGTFKGNLTGTASKATADANGNIITSTYKTKQDAVADVAVTNATATEFISSVTQDTNGVISVEKKKLPNVVTYTQNNNVSVPGASADATTTKTVYKYNQTTIFTPNGLIMGGTAQNAGLATRGICGILTPNNSTGAATKDNLYINYDGDTTYRVNRQLILQAGTQGTNYGNNVYQYAAVRGDAMKAWVEAKGYSTTDEKVKQNIETSNANYPILFSYSTSPTSGANEYVKYTDKITINPYDGCISPNTSGLYDLGTNSYQWKNIYGEYFSGNAATATTAGGITSAGTTAQFWRGDNTWSNILAQPAETTLGIDASDLRIGRAIKTLHIATSGNGTGAGITEGDAAGITFGFSNAAYAGIYYQSSGNYGSRLYFATTSSFGNGAYARMMITHDGKVGIHTTSPSTRLHVDGGVTVTDLTASQAVSTNANKKLVSTNLTTSDPAASGTGISYIATISQSATGKITATKSTVQSASTSQAGILKFTADNTNAQLNTLTIGASNPVDNDYYISQYVNGGTTTTTYHRRPMSALWNYVSGKITNGIYWGNVKTTSAATYKAQPEVASIKINGKTAAGDTDSVSTKNVQLVYDASLETLNFVFS